jgi:hypothetical protein
MRQAFAIFALFFSVRDRPEGLQRLHGLNPAFSASSVVLWNRTFSGRASRAPQDGRQYTPVVLTE